MSFQQLQNKLLETYCEVNLNLLTSKIIAFNKNKQKESLEQMWKVVCDYSKLDYKKRSKYFSKLIMLFHPDKIADYHSKIKACSSEIELENYAHIIPMLSLVNNMPNNNGSGFKTPNEFEEEYGWNYTNTADDYYVVRDEDETVNHLFDEENLDDNFTFGTGPVYPEDSFIGAVKRKIYGPIQIQFPTHQLEDFEEIEMVEYDIELLDGVEYCTYVKVLDLSYNQIFDLTKLEYCIYIQELYLQNNKINYIDALGYLPDLRVLDLANNEISDISILFELKCLEFVNLLGNPVPMNQIEKLKRLGVVVV